MRGSHARATNGVCSSRAFNPRAKNIDPGGENIDDAAKVGKASPIVIFVNGADSDGCSFGSRRVVDRIVIVVFSCDNDGDTVADSALDSRIDSSRVATAEGHAENWV